MLIAFDVTDRRLLIRNRISNRRWQFVLAALASLILANFAAQTILASPAQAADIKLAISPADINKPYFDVTLKPGKSILLQASLRNTSKHSVVARSYPSNVYTIVNGGFGTDLFGAPAAGTTKWTNFDSETLNMAGGSTVNRAFTLKVPAGTPPGQYITSLVIQNKEPTAGSGDGGIQFQHIARSTAAIQIRVPGPLKPGLSIDGASHTVLVQKSVVLLDITNTGNQILKPSASMVVTAESGGAQIGNGTIKMASFYSGTSTKDEFNLDRLLDPGCYLVDAHLNDAATGTDTKRSGLKFCVAGDETQGTREVSAPGTDRWWLLPLGLLVLLALVGAALIWRHRARGKQRAPQVEVEDFSQLSALLNEPDPSQLDAFQILDRRLALGEISPEEYEILRQTLQRE